MRIKEFLLANGHSESSTITIYTMFYGNGVIEQTGILKRQIINRVFPIILSLFRPEGISIVNNTRALNISYYRIMI